MTALRYTIPNGFTAASLLLGTAAIVTAFSGNLELAAWMVVWCGLLDVLDGLAARLLDATSRFGAQFDSLADLVAFGVAPAMLVLQAGVQVGGIEPGSASFAVLLLAVLAFVLAGALRLARFNLGAGAEVPGWFRGVPITAAGSGLLATGVLLLVRHEEQAAMLPLGIYLPLAASLLAFAMVSTLRVPKVARRRSRALNGFQWLNVALSFYCGLTRSFPELLFAMGVVLLVSGLVAGGLTRPATAAGETANGRTRA